MDCMAGIRKGMEQGKFFGCVLDGCMSIEGRDIVLVSSLPLGLDMNMIVLVIVLPTFLNELFRRICLYSWPSSSKDG